jgi:D-lactate dehydrogenase
MRVAFFDTQPFERPSFARANASHGHDITFLDVRLGPATAQLAAGHDAVCVFVNDRVDAPTLNAVHALGVRLVATRTAGFNHIDLAHAARLGRHAAKHRKLVR